MVTASEKLGIFFMMVGDSRLRNDIKALRYAAVIYKAYAWELCEEIGIVTLLKQGSTAERIMKAKGIKNKIFLEHLLDFLVGVKVLKYVSGKYIFIKAPGFEKKKYAYLKKNYPYSVEWTHALRKKAKNTLITGERRFDASFDHRRFLELWDGIMRESPWSFRKLAIKKFCRSIKPDASILDLGCGSGVSTEQILLGCAKPVNITGMDNSEESLKKAKKTLENLYRSTTNQLVRKNIKNVMFIRSDLSKGIPTSKKYDVIFMSLLVNHIPENRRRAFFKSVQKALSGKGTMVVFEIVHKSRFERVAMWVMHAVPTHQQYPFRDEYIRMLKDVFSDVKSYFDGMIVVAKNS